MKSFDYCHTSLPTASLVKTTQFIGQDAHVQRKLLFSTSRTKGVCEHLLFCWIFWSTQDFAGFFLLASSGLSESSSLFARTPSSLAMCFIECYDDSDEPVRIIRRRYDFYRTERIPVSRYPPRVIYTRPRRSCSYVSIDRSYTTATACEEGGASVGLRRILSRSPSGRLIEIRKPSYWRYC